MHKLTDFGRRTEMNGIRIGDDILEQNHPSVRVIIDLW